GGGHRLAVEFDDGALGGVLDAPRDGDGRAGYRGRGLEGDLGRVGAAQRHGSGGGAAEGVDGRVRDGHGLVVRELDRAPHEFGGDVGAAVDVHDELAVLVAGVALRVPDGPVDVQGGGEADA